MNKIVAKLIVLIAFIQLNNIETKAQFVTIPDPNFVTWLSDNYPTCMNGFEMDTTCSSILSETILSINESDISDLTGLEYFDNLIFLDCSNNNLNFLPSLPPTIETLLCNNNQLTILPTLPPFLDIFYCSENNLTSLPDLPATLTNFECYQNQLSSLPTLPSMLMYLACNNNLLTQLPTLPDSLVWLLCNQNQLTNLPELPQLLQILNCSYNLITELPTLSNSLQTFDCSNNLLTELPTLPGSMHVLTCNNNQLTGLPSFPDLMYALLCNENQLTSLPPLSEQFQWFDCSNNNINCFPNFPTNEGFAGTQFDISNNPASCLPNYILAMDPTSLALPLCTINNENACDNSSDLGIVGKIYEDMNSNCDFDIADSLNGNIVLKLYNPLSEEYGLTASAGNGVYNFAVNVGTYLVSLDTLNKPYTSNCAFPGVDSTVLITTASPIMSNVNFDIKCKPNLDLNVQSINHLDGLIFPGQTHTLQVMVGDASQWYGLNCADGSSGVVQLTVSGPLSYSGVAPGALTPIVNGNVFTYTISDFGLINNSTDFKLLFTCDTSAQNGDQICILAEISPVISDLIPTNNSLEYCYSVVNSYDPNYKEVYPMDVLPGYQDWLTYTIHFQNLGTAPAINISVIDTLDNNLDLETFEVINYSHDQQMTLLNGIANFRFSAIMLSDSASDPAGSQGYVQYRIKPIANIEAGTQIENRAHIYFDYNPAVITNTTVNNFISALSVPSINDNATFSIFPNPSQGFITIKGFIKDENYSVVLRDITAKVHKTFQVNNMQEKQFELNGLANGIYTLTISGDNLQSSHKVIIRR
jgi:uncharacterized repeat protein (TIGR01451 family)